MTFTNRSSSAVLDRPRRTPLQEPPRRPAGPSRGDEPQPAVENHPNVMTVPLRRYRYNRLLWRILVHIIDVGLACLPIWSRRKNGADPFRATPLRRVLVIQLDHLGDAVLTTPMLALLRKRHPEATLDVLASPSNASYFATCPHVDSVILSKRTWFDRKQNLWAWAGVVWSLGRSLRSRHYDLGIDVRGDILTILVLWLAGIPRRMGWKMGGGGVSLTDAGTWVPVRHEMLSRFSLTQGLFNGVTGRVPRVERERFSRERAIRERTSVEGDDGGISTRILAARAGRKVSGKFRFPDEADDATAGTGRSSLSSLDRPRVVMHLGAGSSAKRWPLVSWCRLIEGFLERGWRVAIVGAPGDRELSSRIPAHDDLQDLTGTLSFPELAALFERSDLFLGSDSGPAHIAASVRAPSVVLFSGTNDSRQWRPWSSRTLVVRHDAACRPCHRKECPLADHPCMTRIDPDQVLEVALQWATCCQAMS